MDNNDNSIPTAKPKPSLGRIILANIILALFITIPLVFFAVQANRLATIGSQNCTTTYHTSPVDGGGVDSTSSTVCR